MAASAAAARASKPPQQPPPQQQQQQPSSCSSSPEGHVTRGVSGPRSGAPSESARPLRTRLCLPLIERTAPAVELGARRRCHSARLSIFSRVAATAHQALHVTHHHTHTVLSHSTHKSSTTRPRVRYLLSSHHHHIQSITAAKVVHSQPPSPNRAAPRLGRAQQPGCSTASL